MSIVARFPDTDFGDVLVGFIEFATAACLAMDWDEARVAAMADTVAEGLRLRFQEKRTQRVAPNN